MIEPPNVIWTIGHSNHTFEQFSGLLTDEAIEVVVDVRSYPYSRFAPQFNREELGRVLTTSGVRYLYLGDGLGGRPATEDHYDQDGHARYDLMADDPAFKASVGRLLRGTPQHRTALMCSEGQPHDCHRRLLVGKVLAEAGMTLRHILPDGAVRVEETVALGADQAALFGQEETSWRSTQSVSHRRRLSTSSVD